MDEFNRRTLERIRETELSAFGIDKRRMLAATESAQARSALNAMKYAEATHARAAFDAVRYETAHDRAAMDAVRNIPDFARSELNAMKNLSSYSQAIAETERQIATRSLNAITEIERRIASRSLNAITEIERRIATRFGQERTEMFAASQIATRFGQERAGMLAASRITTEAFRTDALQRALSTFDRLNAVQLGSIAGSARLAALSFTNPALESAFSANAFACQVADSLRNALQAQVFDASAFDGLEELIEEKIADLPRDKVTAQGLYRIIFDIVLVLLAVAADIGGSVYEVQEAKRLSDEQNKQQIAIAAQQDARVAQMLELLRQTAEKTAKLVPENDPGKYYVVERDVVLRVKARPKAEKIVVLFPNQRVLLVKDNHKWIYIQYFDYLEGIPRYGWAMKKYFRRVN